MNLYGRCYAKKLNNLDLRTISTKHYELRSEKRKGGEGSWGWEGKVLRMGGWLRMGGVGVEGGGWGVEEGSLSDFWKFLQFGEFPI